MDVESASALGEDRRRALAQGDAHFRAEGRNEMVHRGFFGNDEVGFGDIGFESE